MLRTPIIGIGAISAAGYGAKQGYGVVKSGSDGLTPLSLFESGLKETPLCGQINADVYKSLAADMPNRTSVLAMAAAQEAMAPVKKPGSLRLGITFATTVAGMTRSEIFYRELKKEPSHLKNAATELAFHEPAACAGIVASKLGAQGFHTLSTACSTGLHAIGMAKRLIDHDRFDLCLAIGVDALSILTVRGFASLMLIDFTGCKPFDKRRIGISLGEGAGALLLGSEKAADRIGIRPLGFVSGWGASADCHHMTAPHPEGEGAKNAIRAALTEAGITRNEISMIAAHGTATPDNDLAEIKAMRALFDPLPPFCSMKRTLGHTLAASGAIEAVYAVCALNDNYVPATAGFEQADEAIGAAPSPGEQKQLDHILKTSFGFGGNNAAVIISKV